MSDFGERLKVLRAERGLSQAQLAERAGLHKLGVAKLEQGHREPAWGTVVALAKALGVSCAAFEGVTATPARPPAGRGRPRKSASAADAAPGQNRQPTRTASAPSGKKRRRK
jgi:transcriptional regulator with XRE-family HTH domain